MFKDGNLENYRLQFFKFKSYILRFLAKYCPRLVVLALKWFHRSEIEQAEKFHSILSQSQRIDIFPAKGVGRGFTILIDQKTALYFNQDGDKFVYNGWAAGEYKEKGKVTIFDNLKDE